MQAKFVIYSGCIFCAVLLKPAFLSSTVLEEFCLYHLHILTCELCVMEFNFFVVQCVVFKIFIKTNSQCLSQTEIPAILVIKQLVS